VARQSNRKEFGMKEQRTAAQLARMIEARMTLQASVSVGGQGGEWIAHAVVVGFGRGAFADQQAKKIADDLREEYDLI
jgi:hypothetical protein